MTNPRKPSSPCSSNASKKEPFVPKGGGGGQGHMVARRHAPHLRKMHYGFHGDKNAIANQLGQCEGQGARRPLQYGQAGGSGWLRTEKTRVKNPLGKARDQYA